MTESKGALPSRSRTDRSPLADFVLKTAIAAGMGIVALVIAVEWTLASLDDFVNRNTEIAMTRIEQTIRASTQIATAEVRGSAQTIVADMRQAASGSRFVARVERGIEWLAHPDTEMSPERREKLLAAIRVASARWRPVILEALAIIAGTEGTDAAKKN